MYFQTFLFLKLKTMWMTSMYKRYKYSFDEVLAKVNYGHTISLPKNSYAKFMTQKNESEKVGFFRQSENIL